MFDTFSVDAAKIDKKTNSPKRTAKNCKKRKRKTMTVRYRTNSRQEQAAHAEQCRPYPRGRDDEQQEHDHLYWEFHETDMMGVRMGDWKLVVSGGNCRLYDLATDIHEDTDISAQYPEIVRTMKDIIKKEHTDSQYFRVTLPK